MLGCEKMTDDRFFKVMKSYLSCVTIAALVASSHWGGAADLSGKVKLKGTPPPEITIQMDAVCGKLHPKPVTTRHYVVGQDNGLANVFVYIKQGVSKTPPPAGEPPLLDQVNCIYEPYVMGVVTGQKINIKNSDPFMHNVHATPKPGGNAEFNFAQPVKGQVNPKTFEKPEVLVRIKCDVHNWMFAYVGVVDHPYFAVTDKDGNFTIKNVPPGKYTVEAIHLKAAPAGKGKTQEVQVDGNKTINFELEVPAS
jgi:hypothetical protein